MIPALMLGLGMYALTLAVQMVQVVILVHLASSTNPQSWLRPSHIRNFLLLQGVAAQILLVHLVNIALWAWLFYLCGEFAEYEAAYYHSAVNYSSLGYGNIVMSKQWRLLGPLETVNGMVMFGISTALIFAIAWRLIEQRIKSKSGEPRGYWPARLGPSVISVGCGVSGPCRHSGDFLEGG